jgi:hypothetical protein
MLGTCGEMRKEMAPIFKTGRGQELNPVILMTIYKGLRFPFYSQTYVRCHFRKTNCKAEGSTREFKNMAYLNAGNTA